MIFYDDFSQDNIGDFPAGWNTNGSAEIVTSNLYPGRWMQFIGGGDIWTDSLLTLPENYTIEFDVVPINIMADPITELISTVRKAGISGYPDKKTMNSFTKRKTSFTMLPSGYKNPVFGIMLESENCLICQKPFP